VAKAKEDKETPHKNHGMVATAWMQYMRMLLFSLWFASVKFLHCPIEINVLAHNLAFLA
jgi:hypothetical protein